MDPKKQKAFDAVVKQGLGALTSDDSAKTVMEDASVRGIDKAIADAVDTALEGIVKAAKDAGVDLPPDVIEAAAMTIAGSLVAMAVKSGAEADPKELLMMVQQQLGLDEEPPQEGEMPEEAPPTQGPTDDPRTRPGALRDVR